MPPTEKAYEVADKILKMTVFFEDSEHLEFLVQKALPDLIKSHGSGVKHQLMVWSAGCLSGEEPYTLAMVLSEFAERFPGLGFEFLILATDASVRGLEIARRAIYSEDHTERVPVAMQAKYLLRSKDRSKRLVRINGPLRERVKFRRLNSMEGPLAFREPMDIIFCSNTANQVGQPMWSNLLRRFHQRLSPGGYLFIRNSQGLGEVNVPLKLVAPTVYKKIKTKNQAPHTPCPR
jgi:chemotaxis protein methyltransferase CheR